MHRPTPTEARSRITEIIAESMDLALALKALLEEERKALENQDIDGMDAVSDSKSACAEKLQILDLERCALCREWGFPDGTDQMGQLLGWCDENELLGSRWEQLLAIAAEGSSLNLANGAIIRARQQQFESSLSVLRGITPGPATYGHNGEESGNSSQRSLAEA